LEAAALLPWKAIQSHGAGIAGKAVEKHRFEVVKKEGRCSVFEVLMLAAS
jgi:hypothetical protein